MLAHSTDEGRSWSPRRLLLSPLAAPLQWDTARISALRDRRLAVVANALGEGSGQSVLLFSEDDGESWSIPQRLPLRGMVPDQLVELQSPGHAGRWHLADHSPREDGWEVEGWVSDDRGATWHGPQPIAAERGLKLCEANVVELSTGELVCFLRENSNTGEDTRKVVSRDGGQSWGAPVRFPLPGCHRPVAGRLQSGRVLIPYRFKHGGRRQWGWGQQNFLAALTDEASCRVGLREEARVRILPLDYDRSVAADCGYCGWAQLADGTICIASYIVDDAPKGQIRGYRLRESAFCLGDPFADAAERDATA